MRVDIELDPSDHFLQTYGGESFIDDWMEDNYGIQLGDVSISNIKGDDLSKLAVSAINHLMVNGHRFQFVQTGHPDLPIELKKIPKPL